MATRNSSRTRFIHECEVGRRPSKKPLCPPLETVTSRVWGFSEKAFTGRARGRGRREGGRGRERRKERGREGEKERGREREKGEREREGEEGSE